MQPRQDMILAINNAILVVLFVFAAWLYQGSKREVERHADISAFVLEERLSGATGASPKGLRTGRASRE